MPHLEKLAKLDSGKIYNQTVTGGQQNWEQLDVIKRNATPEQWADVTADNLKLMGQPPAGTRLDDGDFSPGVFLTNWNKLSAKSKEIMFSDGDTREMMDQLASAASGFKQRGRAGNPSGTATTLLAGSTVPAAVIGGFTNLPMTLLAGAGITSSSLLFSSKTLAKVIAGKYPDIAERMLKRLPRAAGLATEAATEDEPPVPLRIDIDRPDHWPARTE